MNTATGKLLDLGIKFGAKAGDTVTIELPKRKGEGGNKMGTEIKLFITGVVAVITIILGVIWGAYYRDIRMAELGYEEVTLAGKQGTAWQKAKLLCKERQ